MWHAVDEVICGQVLFQKTATGTTRTVSPVLTPDYHEEDKLTHHMQLVPANSSDKYHVLDIHRLSDLTQRG
jgi:hypothetical protein